MAKNRLTNGQRTLVGLAVLLMSGIALAPPWVTKSDRMHAWVFDPPAGSAKLDIERLLVQEFVIVGLVAGALLLFWRPAKPPAVVPARESGQSSPPALRSAPVRARVALHLCALIAALLLFLGDYLYFRDFSLIQSYDWRPQSLVVFDPFFKFGLWAGCIGVVALIPWAVARRKTLFLTTFAWLMLTAAGVEIGVHAYAQSAFRSALTSQYSDAELKQLLDAIDEKLKNR